MTFESFFYVVLPALAITVGVLVVLLWFIFWGIPKIRSLRYQNREFRNRELTESRLDEATTILRTLAYNAEDNSMLEVQLGSNCLKDIKTFLNNQPKYLER